MSQSAELNLHLHPKQGEALNTNATEVLYGGAAGGGKSHLMRVASALWCAAIPGLQVYIFRRIRDDLVKNHMEGPKGFRAMLAPWVAAGFCTIVEDEIRFWNGSKIYLCHCKDAKDVYKYQGAEIHVLLIDELTHFSEPMYRFLRSRVRMVGIAVPAGYAGRFPRILCGSNPGNIGHLWVKAFWIEAAVPMACRQMDDEEGGMLRQFIPARLEDNPSMASDDPSYEGKLSGIGSAALVKAMRFGDWNVIDGAFFDQWSTGRHVIAPFDIPAHWTRLRSFDWGFAKPFSVGWWAVASEPVAVPAAGYRVASLGALRGAGDGRAASDAGSFAGGGPRNGAAVQADGDAIGPTDGGGTGRLCIPRGALIRYREWYGAAGADVGLRLEAEQIGLGILKREGAERVQDAVADTQIFAQDGQAYGYKGPTIGERINKVLAKGERTIFRPADKSRKQGWDQFRARLIGDLDGNPMLAVFDTCSDFIRTVPVLQHETLDPEDLDTSAEDHVADEARYAVMSRPWTRPTPQPAKPLVNTATPTLAQLVKRTDQARRGNRARI